MQKRRFGPSESLVAAIGQGTWDIETAVQAVAIEALRRGLDLGMTHIDCAEMYGSGRAEEIVAKAIQGRRDEVFLVSKVLPSNASQRGVVAACEASLARLKTDRLDCYLLHWRGSYALEETLSGFHRLQQAGKIRSWGVSNFDVRDLAEVSALAPEFPPVCNQVLYHLEQRAIEHAVIPWCQQHDIAVVAYSPFGSRGGFVKSDSVGGRVLKTIADAHGATPRQVALNFLQRFDAVFTIPKSSSAIHVEDNANASTWSLSASELAQIDAAYALGPVPRSLPMI